MNKSCSNVDSEATLKCDICNKECCTLKGFISHKKSHENDQFRRCEICGKTFRDPYTLQRHLISTHAQNTKYNEQQKEIHHFNTMEEFTEWKEKIETGTRSRYVQHKGSRVNKDGTTVTYLYCHRDGYFHSEGKNIRNIKCLGSYKINSHCPSKIVVRQLDGITVEFVKEHLGHTMDVGRLSLTKKEKEDIASKISMKIPLEVILDGIRDSIQDDVNRVHLTKKKDLFNIIDQYQLNKEAVHHMNDYTSVDSWVKYMQQSSNLIRFYKPQGEVLDSYPYLQSGDFCLIIANDAQLSLLEKYGNDVLCIDGTHGLNPYDFELYTLLVLDDLREGFPCSFMFSNRGDSLVMELYFKTMQSIINFELKPKYLMSDMAESFYNGWSAVYPNGETRQLFCSWHLDRVWRQNINKIQGKELQIEVYKQIKVLMTERDPSTFNAMAKHIMEQLFSNNNTKSFASYMEKFINDPYPWAYCYRLHAGINTNMHFENLHKNLKYIYMQGKKVKRLDKGIHALMKFTRDKMFDRLITLHKGKVTKNVSDINARHKRSLEMGEEQVQKSSEETWVVLSENSKETYTVSATNSDCSCNLRCSDCSVCIHLYNCTCMDAAIKWNMCKHIHLVHRLNRQGNQENTELPPALPSVPEQQFEIGQSSHQLEPCRDQTQNVSEEEALIRQLSGPGRTSYDLKRSKMLNEVQQILNEMDTEEKIDIFMKHIAPVKSILRSIETKRKITAEAEEQGKNEPHNKKTKPQRRLVSTERKPL